MQSVVQFQSALDFFTTVSKKRDDFFDFAEDYEPVKTFFEGEQSTIFARALDMLAIFDDSKTYIVNEELGRYRRTNAFHYPAGKALCQHSEAA